MSGFPYIFTFYSFKGGVGRSMALLNSAYTLAGWGKHVLMVDMDLEAPGISGFLDRHDELLPVEGDHRPDIFTLLSEVVLSLRAGEKPAAILSKLPPLAQYLRSVRPEKLAPLAPKVGKPGRLDIIPVDMTRDWCARVSGLGLAALSREELLAVSSILHSYFKSHTFPFRPQGFEDFDPDEITPYDYVLVDSRTGVTEIGGLCVGPLADRLVVLSSLNDQNIEGTRAFLTEAGIPPEPRNAASEPWDSADPVKELEQPGLGPKPTLLVASPVPVGELGLKSARLKILADRIGIEPLLLSYHPQLALIETIFTRDFPMEYLAFEYFQLADTVTRLTNDHPAQIVARIFQGDLQEANMGIRIRKALRAVVHDPDIGLSVLTSLSKELTQTPYEDSIHARLLHAAMTSTSFRPVAFYNWGLTLASQADNKSKDLAIQFYTAAIEKYKEALTLKPDLHEAYSEWGLALANQAKAKTGAEAERLFEDAERKFAAALVNGPKNHTTLNKWGCMLLDRARKNTGKLSEQFYLAAGEKFEEALKINPDSYEALNNWGNALADQSTGMPSPLSDSIHAAAEAKYSEALKLKPNDFEVLNNWGCALMERAKIKTGADSDRLFTISLEKFALAEQVQPGSAAFNRACLNALRGEVSEAIRWLKVWISTGKMLTRTEISEDRDFDPIRNVPAFLDFLSTLPEE